MTDDHALFGYRLRQFTLAEELGNVSVACRRWARPLDLLPAQAEDRPLGTRGAENR